MGHFRRFTQAQRVKQHVPLPGDHLDQNIFGRLELLPPARLHAIPANGQARRLQGMDVGQVEISPRCQVGLQALKRLDPQFHVLVGQEDLLGVAGQLFVGDRLVRCRLTVLETRQIRHDPVELLDPCHYCAVLPLELAGHFGGRLNVHRAQGLEKTHGLLLDIDRTHNEHPRHPGYGHVPAPPQYESVSSIMAASVMRLATLATPTAAACWSWR